MRVWLVDGLCVALQRPQGVVGLLLDRLLLSPRQALSQRQAHMRPQESLPLRLQPQRIPHRLSTVVLHQWRRLLDDVLTMLTLLLVGAAVAAGYSAAWSP
jgi:hypothetical protein